MMHSVLLIASTLLLVAVSADARRVSTAPVAVRGAVETNTIRVCSRWPERGVEVHVSRPDIYGLRTGWTPFERQYPARGAVKLKAPETADGLAFHHWEIAKDTYLRTRAVRVIPTLDVHVTVIFLRAQGAASFSYRSTRRRDTLIASGFEPPLSNLFASGKARGFGIRALDAQGMLLHGPFELQSRAGGAMWMYNGAKQRSAVIRCYPAYDLVVYVAYTNLPHEFELFTWAPEPPRASGAAPQEQQQKDGCAHASGDDAHRNFRGSEPSAGAHVTQGQHGPAKER